MNILFGLSRRAGRPLSDYLHFPDALCIFMSLVFIGGHFSFAVDTRT
jgi:hypothetical protein